MMDHVQLTLPHESLGMPPFKLQNGYLLLASFEWTRATPSTPPPYLKDCLTRKPKFLPSACIKPKNLPGLGKGWLFLQAQPPRKYEGSQRLLSRWAAQSFQQPSSWAKARPLLHISITNGAEYDFQEILNSKLSYSKIRYKVKWVGYNDDHNWYYYSEVIYSPHKICEFIGSTSLQKGHHEIS